jgi:hypothetical protein
VNSPSNRTGLSITGIVAAATMLALSIPTARADVVVSPLNCPVISGSACTTTTASYGTITFSDDLGNPNNVDIGISLTNGLTIQQIVLNYDQSKFNNATPFTAAVGGTSVVVQNSENNVTLLGSGNFGGFDLGIPSTGSLTTFGSNFTVVLSADNLNLNAVDFANQLNGGLDAAVHLQNCGPNGATCQPGIVGANSLAVGERPTSVPEPASLVLFGTALIGLGLLGRRRRTNV